MDRAKISRRRLHDALSMIFDGCVDPNEVKALTLFDDVIMVDLADGHLGYIDITPATVSAQLALVP